MNNTFFLVVYAYDFNRVNFGIKSEFKYNFGLLQFKNLFLIRARNRHIRFI